MDLDIDVESFEFNITPGKSHPMKVEYLSETREVLIRAGLPKQESLTLDIDNDVIAVRFKRLDLRFSEEAIRELFEGLPPEMLRRL